VNVRCAHDQLVPIGDLRPYPKNRNKHPEEQIKRLADILKYQGWRYPVKVSKQSGYVTAGHGRIEAAKLNGWIEVPVNFQDYDDEEQEYADVQADNAIASWAELDVSGINTDLADLGPDFEVDMLGLRKFMLEPADKFLPEEEWHDMPEFNQPDQMAHRTIKVHFATDYHVEQFAKLVAQGITDKTKYIWFPKAEKQDTESKRYG
jgi:hypothetical protein